MPRRRGPDGSDRAACDAEPVADTRGKEANAMSKFDHMTMGEVREHAAAGHPEAVAILESCQLSERKLAETLQRTDRARRERRRRIAVENRAARERSVAMLAEMAATRQAIECAEGRADDAEGREGEALELARRNYRVAVVATVIAILSLVVAVLA